MQRLDISDFWPKTCHARWMSSEHTPGLVSVVMPTYNRTSRLLRALDSVKRQTYRPIEIIVVDDGSTDGSPVVIAEWTKQNEEEQFLVRYLRQVNRGAPAARNLGLIESKGEYIQYLDSDDILISEKLCVQIDAINTFNVDFVWSQLKVLTEVSYNKHRLEHLMSEDGDLFFVSANDMPDAVYVGLYRRDLCIAIGPWDETLCCRQDFDYRYRCEVLNPTRQYIPQVCYVAIDHHDARVHDKYNTAEGAELILRLLDNAAMCARYAGLNLNLYGRYFLALRISLGCDRKELIWQSLSGLKQASPTIVKNWMGRFLGLIYAVFGSPTTLRLLDIYSAISMQVDSRA